MDIVFTALGLVVGFFVSRFLSKPIHIKPNRLPRLGIKRVEIMPNLLIQTTKWKIHVHHWMTLSLVFAVLILTTASFNHLLLVKSLCLGGIIQGITYRDRFHIFKDHS
jgi:hypothetical protein